ncbi:MAG: EamA family transporter RarD [Alphaproteobacteria bacterium]|nr:EamA family transporter RarD [Alphaproteobacteria bacterium]
MSPRQKIDTGVIYAASAFVIWGVIPIYWKEALGGIDAVEIVMHRIVWTLVFAIAALAAWERLPKLYEALTTRRSIMALSVSAVLIAINWGIFIWAVTVDRIIETSLGYYINPLVNFVLGAAFLGERLTRIQLIAVALATLGVLNQTLSLGYLPWVSLVLAVSFGFYGLIRKTVAVESLEGLTVESIILAPAALGYIAYLTVTKQGAFTHVNWMTDLNLVIAGPLTAIPLLLFAAGARLVRLSTIGFLQYLAPSIALLIAVFIYHEPFTTAHAITFACIWAALILISWEALRRDAYSAA